MCPWCRDNTDDYRVSPARNINLVNFQVPNGYLYWDLKIDNCYNSNWCVLFLGHSVVCKCIVPIPWHMVPWLVTKGRQKLHGSSIKCLFWKMYCFDQTNWVWDFSIVVRKELGWQNFYCCWWTVTINYNRFASIIHHFSCLP